MNPDRALSLRGDTEAFRSGLPAPDLASQSTGLFVTVRVGGQMLGLPIGKVREIFYVDRIFPVPRASPYVAGLINLRGRIILLADMRAWLSFLPAKPDGNERLCVAVENGDDIDGLLVDEIGDILALPTSRASPPPPRLDEHWRQICTAVHRLDRELMLEIDPTSIFREHKTGEVQSYMSAIQ